MLRPGLSLLIDLAWPPLCALCRRAATEAFGLCRGCRARLDLIPWRGARCDSCGRPAIAGAESDAASPADARCEACAREPPPFDRAASAARYAGAARDLIFLFKFHRELALAAPLGDLLDRAIAMAGREFDVVVPVPSHPRRERLRRFAPVRILAREAAERARRAYRDRWVRRARYAAPQGDPSTRSRRENVAGAFVPTGARALLAPRTPAGLRVLLVDDVLTSGSTARECAKALRAAGAREIVVATIARGGLGSEAPARAARPGGGFAAPMRDGMEG